MALKAENIVLSNGKKKKPAVWSAHDRRIKTVLFMVSYVTVSPTNSLLGVAPVHIELLFSCDTRTFALSLTLQSVGFFLGALLCSTLLRGVCSELLFGATLLLIALTTCCAPFCPSIVWFMLLIALQGCCVSVFNSEAQAFFLRLWSDHRLKGPFMQTLPALWSLSSALSPLIVTPFLADLSPLKLNNSDTPHPGLQNQTEFDDFTQMTPYTKPTVDVTMIRYVFLIFGAPNVIPAVAFFALFAVGGAPVFHGRIRCVATRAQSNMSSDVVGEKNTRRRLYDQLTIALVCAFFFFLMLSDERAFLAQFVMKHLGWPARHGTLVAMAFFGAMCAGRVVGVPLSYWLHPRIVLAINLGFIGSAAALFLCAELHDGVVWGAAAALGYGVSTTFGAMALLASERLVVTGRVMACFILGTSSGGILGPLLVGHLFVAYTPMCVGYVMAGAAVVDGVIFVGLVTTVAIGGRDGGVGVSGEVVGLNEVCRGDEGGTGEVEKEQSGVEERIIVEEAISETDVVLNSASMDVEA